MKTVIMTEEELSCLLTKCVRDVVSEQMAGLSIPRNQTEKTEFLSRKEAARLLGVSLVTLHDHTMQGVLPAYRYGKKVLYKRSEVIGAVTRIKV